MKKVICTAAAFMMVAGVATVASAEVKLSGDARARLIYNDTGIDGVDSHDKWDSRIRVVFQGTSEGGAYIKARLRFIDGTWGTGYEYSSSAKGGNNVWSDYAFLGFKKGKLDVAAGKMPIGFSAWFLDDERTDRFRVRYNFAKGAFVAFTYDKKIYGDSYATVITMATVDGGTYKTKAWESNKYDGDKDVWGVTYKQKFSDAMTMKARAVYVTDDTGMDKEGFKGSVNLKMAFAGNNIILEQSYKEGDTAMVGADDQYGGYAEWNANLGAVTPTVRVGYTADGFSADETFGWLMVGGDEPISKIKRLGSTGDTVFVGASAKFHASEALSFQGNAVFLDVDSYNLVYGDNPIELSGQADYILGKGVKLSAKIGWLGSDGPADDAFGSYARMEVGF